MNVNNAHPLASPGNGLCAYGKEALHPNRNPQVRRRCRRRTCFLAISHFERDYPAGTKASTSASSKSAKPIWAKSTSAYRPLSSTSF